MAVTMISKSYLPAKEPEVAGPSRPIVYQASIKAAPAKPAPKKAKPRYKDWNDVNHGSLVYQNWCSLAELNKCFRLRRRFNYMSQPNRVNYVALFKRLYGPSGFSGKERFPARDRRVNLSASKIANVVRDLVAALEIDDLKSVQMRAALENYEHLCCKLNSMIHHGKAENHVKNGIYSRSSFEKRFNLNWG